jgi:hypothetical protein
LSHESFDRSTPVQGSSNRALGVVFAAVFAIIGAFPVLFGGAPRWWSLAVAAVFALIAFLAPALLGPLNRLWTRFGLLLHRIVSPLVLGFMFFLVVTPIALLMRALGKDPLRLRFEAGARSYWIERTPPGPPPQSLPDQF